jgi:hypothetical protein
MGEEATRKVARYFDWQITQGTSSPCLACSEIKVKKKSFGVKANQVRLPYQRSTDDESSLIGTRFYIDQATVKPSPEGLKLNKPHIKMPVEGATQLKLPSFLARKIDQVSETCELLHSFQHKGMPVSKIRCDNAGENKVLERTLKSAQWRMTNVEMEYTARDTPQQNSIAELGIWHTVLKAKT